MRDDGSINRERLVRFFYMPGIFQKVKIPRPRPKHFKRPVADMLFYGLAKDDIVFVTIVRSRNSELKHSRQRSLQDPQRICHVALNSAHNRSGGS
jgi:hypothetical protein